MKINKLTFYISMIINILLLIISAILYFSFEGNYTISYIVSILLNIFAGSVILSVTSLVNYYVYRRYLLRDIMNECINISNVFSNLKYFIPKKYNEDEFTNITSKDDEIIKKYKEKIMTDNKAELKSILSEYIKISKVSTRELWNMYDDLDFITDFSKKKKKTYYNLIFNYIDSKIKMIKDFSYDFKIYISANSGNYEINKEYLYKLQDKIFFHKVYDCKKDNNLKSVISNLDVGYEIAHDLTAKKFTIIYNEISNHLLKMFDIVEKDNYFNKNYSGTGSEENE